MHLLRGKRSDRKRGRRDDTWAADTRDRAVLSNDAFNHYYKANVVDETEWEAFMGVLLSPLPMSLRVHTFLPCAGAIVEYLNTRLSAVSPTSLIPFVPGGTALQSAVSRSDLKRGDELKNLKAIITALSDGGYLTRQETVSMIPPVLLQVRPGDRVLDMCAAPGSKTSQILESLLSSAEGGVVVANDFNASRLYILLSQTARLPGAHSHLIATNYDATQFPLLPPEDKFDRVLCDVMCSGDGTLRKSVDMWDRWHTLRGANLHHSQVRTLTRGMMLCKKGGILVYSTCSLNPVENEAVVSECLAAAKGAFRLTDPTPLLPGLVASPGMTDWSLLTKDLTKRLHTMEEAQKERGFRYRASMFPNREQLQEQNIHYTRRVLPHHQDTGGFFFAVMECVEDYPVAAKASTSDTKDRTFKPISSELQEVVRGALDLPPSFPTDQLFVRGEVWKEQKLNFANKAVCALLPKLGSRVLHVGCKVFESYVAYSNDKLCFSAVGVGALVSLLPASFVVEVGPELVLRLSQGKLGETELLPLPPHECFVLKCNMAVVGAIHIAAGRRESGYVSAKVEAWQVALAKFTLGRPLADCDAEETTTTTATTTVVAREN